MSGFSSAVSNETKIKLLAITMAMETYTIGASMVGMSTSNSIVFVANFVIAVTGALASGLSLYTIKQMSRGADLKNTYGFGRFETASSIVVGLTMIMAVGFIAFEAFNKIIHPVEQQGGLVGILLTCVSFVVSLWLWVRNYRLTRTEHSPIFEAMWRMARMGALEDLLIIGAVGISLIFSGHGWARFLDAGASLLLAVALIKSIKDIMSGSISDLLDRSLDERDQIIIIRELVNHFDRYDQIHGFRTRRSGSQIFVELFLEFDSSQPMCEIYDVIAVLEAAIKKQLPHAQVMIVPSRGDQPS
jgi:ferrous-iron efflux pump FieF